MKSPPGGRASIGLYFYFTGLGKIVGQERQGLILPGTAVPGYRLFPPSDSDKHTPLRCASFGLFVLDETNSCTVPDGTREFLFSSPALPCRARDCFVPSELERARDNLDSHPLHCRAGLEIVS